MTNHPNSSANQLATCTLRTFPYARINSTQNSCFSLRITLVHAYDTRASLGLKLRRVEALNRDCFPDRGLVAGTNGHWRCIVAVRPPVHPHKLAAAQSYLLSFVASLTPPQVESSPRDERVRPWPDMQQAEGNITENISAGYYIPRCQSPHSNAVLSAFQ